MREFVWVRVAGVLAGVAALVAGPVAGRAADPGAFLLPPVAAPARSEPSSDLPSNSRVDPAPTPVPLTPAPQPSPPRDDRIVPFAAVRDTRPRDPEPATALPPRAATLAPPRDIVPVAAQNFEDSRPPAEPDRRRERPTDLLDYLTGKDEFGPRGSGRSSERFRDKVADAVAGENGRDWFKSDHCFDAFISPVTNPFLFEDPRSTTEVRPLFIYQRVPSKEPVFQGGNVTFIGTQGRLAVTDRWSFVFNKLGGIGVNPSNPNLSDHTGFAELWLGPKFTFLRDQDRGSVAAGGLTFQIPAGSSNVNQNTGTLSIVPYLSYAQNFGEMKFGSFNTVLGTGYSFSVNKERSDYYYLSGHLDFDVANLHRFYPLVELNWFYNTTNGNQSPYTFEGRDLVNFGSQGKGSNLLTGALGGRVKITKSIETGAAFEIPLAGNRDLFQYRWTVDFIWRY